MATVLMNTAYEIVFANQNIGQKAEDNPTVKVIAGDWQADGAVETGVVVEVYGDQFPILTAVDARKLSKWLARAADALENVKPQKKKGNTRQHYETDDSDDYGFRIKK